MFAIIAAVCCLAYANGANDNFKGVATLYGSGTVNFRGALWWATLTTLLGSLAAIFLADQLLQSFKGRGLVEAALTTNANYVTAVAWGAGLTVLLATKIGMPISTTHGLVGALVGAGWAAGSEINLQSLAANFFVPLMVSPLLAIVATSMCYTLLHALRVRAGITAETCFCAGQETLEIVPVLATTAALARVEQLTLTTGTAVTCHNRYRGELLGIELAQVVDGLHYLSAGAVSFARGMNDTPKIAALLLVMPVLVGAGGKLASLAFVAVLMMAGGLVSARRVADTMSRKITPMNHGQGFTANLLTSVIVLCASALGKPVSTTHVSCGALFGIGAVHGQADWKMVGKILGAWVTTLPVGAAIGAATYWAIRVMAS